MACLSIVFSVPSVISVVKDFTAFASRKNSKAFNTGNIMGTERTEKKASVWANHFLSQLHERFR